MVYHCVNYVGRTTGLYGLIAHLVERRVRNAEARGSNPLKSTIVYQEFGYRNPGH